MESKKRYNSLTGFIIGGIIGTIVFISIGVTVMMLTLVNTDSKSDNKLAGNKTESVASNTNKALEGVMGQNEAKAESNNKAKEKSVFDDIVEGTPEMHDKIKDEFYKAEKKIEDKRNIDENIANIEKKATQFSKRAVDFEDKRKVLAGYETVEENLKEANENVKNNKSTDERVIEEANYNLMENQRLIRASIIQLEE